jgi:hypothetical protein
MQLIYIFIIIISIATLYKYLESEAYEVIYVKATNSNKEYLVRNLPDKQHAADMLHNMNENFQKMVNYLKTEDLVKTFNKFVLKRNNIPINKLSETELTLLNKYTDDVKRFIKNYNPESLSENVPSSVYTSYSENKGQRIVFCMRNKKTNELVSLNTMMFVGIHELAHVMTLSIGHKPEFWENMKILLRLAIHLNLYNCINYNINSVGYCGMEINDSPLKCTDI